MRLWVVILCLASLNTHADIKVQGHRGARAVMPENSLAAFQYALQIGVDVLELDLVVSKDNALVISHDPVINNQLCLRDGKPVKPGQPVISFTLAQLRHFDCGSIRHPGFPRQLPQAGQHMPTLQELFTLVKRSPLPVARTVSFNIETKISPTQPELTPSPEIFTQLVLAQVRAFGWQHRVVIQSFDYRTLQWVKKLAPQIKTSQLTRRNFTDLVAVAQSVQADYISPDWQSISAGMVAKLHANQLKVAPWTANTVAAWDYLVDIGVDEIITDDPAALIKYLQERGLRGN